MTSGFAASARAPAPAVEVLPEGALRGGPSGPIGDRTAFVIAHRISTVRDADLILIMDEGRIVAQGTHDELLRESEIYHLIVESQLAGAGELATVAGGAA